MSLFKLNLEALDAFIFVQKSILDKSFVEFGIVLVRLKFSIQAREEIAVYSIEKTIFIKIALSCQPMS